MKIKIYLMTLILAFILRGSLQAGSASLVGGSGYFMIGMNHVSLSSLNSQYEGAGFESFSPDFLSLGGGGHWIFRHFLIGGEGYGLSGKAVTSRGFRNQIMGGMGFFNLGYILFSSENFFLYPLLGLGGGAMNIRMTSTSETPSFHQVLQNPKNETLLEKGGFIINLSLGAEYLINFSPVNKGGIILGIRLGYLLMPAKSSWRMNTVEISGGPDVGWDGAYFKLLIGMGGFRKL